MGQDGGGLEVGEMGDAEFPNVGALYSVVGRPRHKKGTLDGFLNFR